MFFDDLRQAVLDEFSTPKTRIHGGKIHGLQCPECGGNEAYAYEEKPFSLNCNRKNQCGSRTRTIPLFALSAQVEQKYPPTKADQHWPARAYIESRGIPPEIIAKSGFEYHPQTRKGCGGGVMFPVGEDDNGKKIYNGRLFNPPPKEGKTHNIGAVSGHHWKMPEMNYDCDRTTYMTEGIMDALSLIAIGEQAVAVLGAGYDPAKFNLSEFHDLTIAFDCDKAGVGFTKRWLDHFAKMEPEKSPPRISAIMPIDGDWNTLLCMSANAEEAGRTFRDNLDRYKHQAALGLAESAQGYAEIYTTGNDGRPPGLFAFQGQFFWSYKKIKKLDGIDIPTVLTDRVSDCLISVKHFRRYDKDEDLPVFLYCLEVKPKNGRPTRMTITGDNLKSADAVTGSLLKHGKAHWRGGPEATKALAERILHSKAPIVRQAEFTGYDHKTGHYILKDFAIDQKGEMLLPDKDGFFKADHGNEFVQPSSTETIKPIQGCDVVKMYHLFIGAWGDNAAVAVAFLVASLFVNQVKRITKFFPFLSLYGDPQTGKSRLVTTLNAMQCLNEEGLPMIGGNTRKGELRTLSQVSGCMKALIEGNNPDKSRFDFESILPLYNFGNPLQVRALTTNDSRTHGLPFYGTLAFVQNVEPFKSRAARERVISLRFSEENITDTTKKAFDEIIALPLQVLAGFYPVIMKYRPLIESSWVQQFEQAKKDLKGEIPDNRINENYALILAFHRMLNTHFEIHYDLHPFIAQIGKVKMDSVRQRILTSADNFFDTINTIPESFLCLKEREGTTMHKNEFMDMRGAELFINIPGALKAIKEAGFTTDYPDRLQASLQAHPAFIKASVNHRFRGAPDRPLKAMIFDCKRMDG
ncbi:MAG: toprim domain-containing protein [Proteobacteria bacterium]|nr:toprim domain-containing protein [Pseudomonadota bacterium]